MERTTWSDERLQERLDSVDASVSGVKDEVLELRREIRAEFAEGRAEMRAQRGEIDRLRLTIFRVGGAVLAVLVGVIASGVS